MILSRRIALVAFAGTAFAVASASVFAFSSKAPFTTSAFDAALASGKSVLVEVSAPWCPTCKAQKPILSNLSSKKEFAGLVVFEVDFDSQKDALRKLNVQQQSTLIVYKAKVEAGRSTGDTNPASIEALLKKAN